MEIFLIIIGVLAVFIIVQLLNMNTAGSDQKRSEPDFGIAKYLSEKQEAKKKTEEIEH